MDGLSIKVNKDKISQKLKIVSKNLKDIEAPLKLAGVYMMKSIDRNFRQGGRPNRWKPLSQHTINRKGSSAILQDTGTLKNSIVYKLTGSMKDTLIIEPRGTNSKTGINVKQYGEVHQTGKTIRVTRGKSNWVVTIPKRKFLLFQQEDYKMIKKIFTKYIEESTKQ